MNYICHPWRFGNPSHLYPEAGPGTIRSELRLLNIPFKKQPQRCIESEIPATSATETFFSMLNPPSSLVESCLSHYIRLSMNMSPGSPKSEATVAPPG